jgi:two-component system, LytTR family, response regulator
MKAIIIDDEAPCCKVIEQVLAKYCPQVQVLAVCKDGLEGLNAISKFQPDVVFLDIEMPRMNGFQMLEALGPNDLPFSLVFTTAYDQFAVKAFKFSAFDYLLKPIDNEELITVIQKLERHQTRYDQLQHLKDKIRQQTPFDKISIATTKGLTFINLANIVAIEADGNYSTFHLLEGKPVIASKNLSFFEEILGDNPSFFRSHKQFIINLAHAQEYLSVEGLIVLPNGIKAKLARTRKELFLSLVK